MRVFLHWWSFALMVSLWILRDKSLQVFRILLSILADVNNAVVWMVSSRPLFSMSSKLFISPLRDYTDGTNYNFMFHSFFFLFSVLWRIYLSFHFPSVLPSGQPERQILQFTTFSIFPFFFPFFFFFFFAVVVDYHLVWSSNRDSVIRLYLKIQRSLSVSFSMMDSWLCIYHLFVWSNSNFLFIRVFAGIWGTASLLKSPGLFSVFWPFSIM